MGKALDAGAAIGAASLLLSGYQLLIALGPDIRTVRDSGPGTPVALDVRTAELTAGLLVVAAGAAVSGATGQWWPFLLSVTAVGGAVAVYEGTLRYQRRRAG